MIDFILHLDNHIVELVNNYGTFVYAILFLIVFCETGLVVVPFLPGDSLLFMAGALSVNGTLNVVAVFIIFVAAAILGDALNYQIGKRLGKRVERSDSPRFINQKNIEQTQEFFQRHGAKTIVIARFVPIVRTFAPFLAGAGHMRYARFFGYNVVGAVLWVTTFVLAGYLFGNIPFIKNNLTLIVIGMILITLIPIMVYKLRDMIKANKKTKKSH
jgi:membrane-associated protein